MSTRENIRLIARTPLLNFLGKKIKCSGSLAFYLFSLTHLINSIKNEHSRKILYLCWKHVDRYRNSLLNPVLGTLT